MVRLSQERTNIPVFPISIANLTPDSKRIAAGERESGGPVCTSNFSNESGAGRVDVKMTGIFAAASSVATSDASEAP